MLQSFVTTAPLPSPPLPLPSLPPPPKHTYQDGWGIAGLMCGAVTFRVPLQCRVNAGLVILCKYTPLEFTIIKSRAMTLSRSPQCRAFSRAMMDEKSLSPLFPHRWGSRLQMTGYYFDSPFHMLQNRICLIFDHPSIPVLDWSPREQTKLQENDKITTHYSADVNGTLAPSVLFASDLVLFEYKLS